MEQINADLVDKFWASFRNIQSFGPSKPYALRVEGNMCRRADLEWYERYDKEEYIRKSSVWVEFHPKERPVFVKDDIGIRFTSTEFAFNSIIPTMILAEWDTPDCLGALLSGRDETAPSEKPVLLWWQIEEEKKKQQQKEIIDLRNSIRFWHGM